MPLAITGSRALDRLMALSVSVDDNIYLNYWDREGTINSKRLSRVAKQLKAAMCLEIADDDNTIFVGGCDQLDIYEGAPVISAVRFNEYMVHVDSIALNDKEMRNVFQLKKLTGMRGILIAGGFNSISLLHFDYEENRFSELKQLSCLHSGEIFDFVVRGKDIFSICSSDKYIHRF